MGKRNYSVKVTLKKDDEILEFPSIFKAIIEMSIITGKSESYFATRFNQRQTNIAGYRRRVAKAPCFSYGDEATLFFLKNFFLSCKMPMLNALKWLGHQPLQETL